MVMNILVIDDTKVHLTAAKQTLTGHDVTICTSHDKAIKLLDGRYDIVEQYRIVQRYESEGMKNWEAREKAKSETKLPYWDAVLCDLLMPAGSHNQPEDSIFVGQEMAVGWSLALQAVVNGAKFVAVATDLGHHSHPASAMLDGLGYHIFEIDGAKMLLTNVVPLVGITGTECICVECNGTGKLSNGYSTCWDCHGTGKNFAEKGKNWGYILDQLLEK